MERLITPGALLSPDGPLRPKSDVLIPPEFNLPPAADQPRMSNGVGPGQWEASAGAARLDTTVQKQAFAGGNGRKGLHLLYLFAFWSQFKPSEPFLVDYFVDEKGFSNKQVYQQVFNLFVYARLPCIALVGVLSESPCCDGRRLLVGGAIFGLATVVLTRFGTTLLIQQVAQFTVAAAFASRIAIQPLAFTLTMPSQYQESVHTVRAMLLLSNFFSAVLGELLRDIGTPLDTLFDISLVGQIISLLCAVLLPTQDSDVSAVDVEHETDRRDFELHSLPCVKAALRDLWLSMRLRGVMWWTAWALAMSPAHGLTMTIWQSLVRANHIGTDHNGMLLAGMYLVSAFLTMASGSSPPLRALTSFLVISSMISAGLLLCWVSAQSTELSIYSGIFLYVCLLEVMSTVRTYQVGAEVTRVSTASTSKALHGVGGRPVLQSARLTLLFSATGLLVAFNEAMVQVVINGWHHIASRFLGLGSGLLLAAAALTVARAGEATLTQRAPARLAAGGTNGKQPANAGATCQKGLAPAAAQSRPLWTSWIPGCSKSQPYSPRKPSGAPLLLHEGPGTSGTS